MTALATLIFTAAALTVAHVIAGTLLPAWARIVALFREAGHA